MSIRSHIRVSEYASTNSRQPRTRVVSCAAKRSQEGTWRLTLTQRPPIAEERKGLDGKRWQEQKAGLSSSESKAACTCSHRHTREKRNQDTPNTTPYFLSLSLSLSLFKWLSESKWSRVPPYAQVNWPPHWSLPVWGSFTSLLYSLRDTSLQFTEQLIQLKTLIYITCVLVFTTTWVLIVFTNICVNSESSEEDSLEESTQIHFCPLLLFSSLLFGLPFNFVTFFLTYPSPLVNYIFILHLTAAFLTLATLHDVPFIFWSNSIII